jgi:hypothetical protein
MLLCLAYLFAWKPSPLFSSISAKILIRLVSVFCGRINKFSVVMLKGDDCWHLRHKKLYWFGTKPYVQSWRPWVKLIDDIAHHLNAKILRDFFELWQLIHTLHLDHSSEQEDVIVWILESSGEYTAKSAYEIQFSDQVHGFLFWQNFTKISKNSYFSLRSEKIYIGQIF